MDEEKQILDLEIPFPQIEGKSERQIWYAECLRYEYVVQNEGRFREIEESMMMEIDRRIRMLEPYDCMCEGTFEEEYTNAEKACLYGVDAGGIIAALRNEVRWGNEKD